MKGIVMRAIIIYQSAYGHVNQMAQSIEKGLIESGVEVKLSSALETDPSEVLDYDALVLGSPVRMGSIGDEMKSFIDKLGGIWMKAAAKNKVGGVFVSGGGFASGIELTQISLYSTLIELGMVLVGCVNDMPGFGTGANQWGPFAQVGLEGKDGPNEDSLTACNEYGKRLGWAIKRFRDK
ncbi:MAG: Trp repressor-binding protein [candidate division Zixibacteria bacterium]|nr:Trp repressor-binding protein [candidate division Zixibacteria bacterium]